MVNGKVVAGAVIVSNSTNRALLLRRAPHEKMPGIWEFPSGKQRPGEPIESCLIREISEETGQYLDPSHVSAELRSFTYGSTTQYNFLIQVSEEFIPVLSSEHDSYSWEQVGSDKFDDVLASIAEEAMSSLISLV